MDLTNEIIYPHLVFLFNRLIVVHKKGDNIYSTFLE